MSISGYVIVSTGYSWGNVGLSGNLGINGVLYGYPSWNQYTLQQKVKDAQEYIDFLKENQRRLREIIG